LRKGDRFLSYYENNEGKRVYVTEVIADNVRFLESQNSGNSSRRDDAPPEGRGGGNYGSGGSGSGGNRNHQDPFQNDGKPIDISDDDLPF
jgi:single-strand DNA-binding protein